MKVVVLGAGGLVGARLVERLLAAPSLEVAGHGTVAIAQILLVDMRAPDSPPTDPRVKIATGELQDDAFLASCLEPDGAAVCVTYHLAALLSGYAEENFDLGMQVNLQVPIKVMEQVRKLSAQLGTPQIYVFVSTDYVTCFNQYNREHPCTEESFCLSPVSYGIQKACVEKLLCDYSRKGFIDGRVGRLSAVIGRPGWSNSVSYPYTGIFTQTLEGKTYEVPLPMDIPYPISALDNNIGCLVHFPSVTAESLGHNRVVQLPAKSVTLSDIWTAAQQVAKERGIAIGSIAEVAADAGTTTVKTINVCPYVDCTKAKDLGFPMDVDLGIIIGDYCDRYLSKA